jgi:glyceraldehyde 3-phosphate dehydrogenase
MRVGINGFGRIGRLALRIASTHPDITWHCINEPGSDSAIAAYLYNYDSVHGRATPMATASATALTIGTQQIPYVSQKGIEAHDWAGCDIVLECSGKYRTVESLAGFFAAGVKRVIVAAPISKQAINIVMGVNQHRYDVHTQRGYGCLVHYQLLGANCASDASADWHSPRHDYDDALHDQYAECDRQTEQRQTPRQSSITQHDSHLHGISINDWADYP